MENDQINTVSTGILEFLEARKLKNKASVNDVIKEAEKSGSPLLEKVKKFPGLLKRIGVEKAYVVGDLSIVKCVYGYTRETDEGEEAALMNFKPDKSCEDKIPVYSNKTDTEAILFEFDRKAIMEWLKENNEIKEIPKDEVSMKLWFLNNVKPDKIMRVSEIPESERMTKIIYTLIHSISHSLLKKASTQCGIDRDSLGEIIFPNIPALIIYSNNSSSFQLGGLFTLFESKIRPWVDLALQDAENCIYDPICKGDTGACHACLFTSEISCENFNSDLSRNLLIGGKFINKDFKGFWSMSSRGET